MIVHMNLCDLCSEYYLGHLNEVDLRRFRKHLKSCSKCQADLADMVQTRRWVDNKRHSARTKASNVVIFPKTMPHPTKRRMPVWMSLARFVWVASACAVMIVPNLGVVLTREMHAVYVRADNVEDASERSIHLGLMAVLEKGREESNLNKQRYIPRGDLNQSLVSLHVRIRI